MTTSLFSRVELLRDVPASALRHLLMPTAPAARTVSSHRLIWTLFGDTADRERDFHLVEGKRVGPPVAAIDDIEAVIVAVGLAIHREELRLLLDVIADQVFEQPVTKIHHEHEVVVFNLARDPLEHGTLQRLAGVLGVDEIHRKEFRQLLALASRLDKALLPRS